jgi:glycosyltransferase involved in cell wall biosynthesis
MRLVRVAVNAEQLLYRSPGGIGRYTAQLLTVLPRLYPGDEVVPFTARHQRGQVHAALRAAGVDPTTLGRAAVLSLPRPVLYEAWLGMGRPRLPRLGGVQLVHAPSVAVPPNPGVPLVVTVHDAAPERFPEAFPARGRRFHRRALAAVARRADLVLTVSAAAAEEVTQYSAIRANRIRVVPNGIAPLAVSRERRLDILAGWGLAGRPFVLWVGSLEPRKGVGTLVAAMARLRSGRTTGSADGPQLVLAGYPGWLSDDLFAPADRDALGPALRQLGTVSEEALWSLYAEASLFAFPSRHEGFGLPVLEAMSQGAPVVAADIPALREIAGGVARLVPPGDVEAWAAAIEDVLGDEAERERLGAAGAIHARNFGVDETIAAVHAVYQELVGG